MKYFFIHSIIALMSSSVFSSSLLEGNWNCEISDKENPHLSSISSFIVSEYGDYSRTINMTAYWENGDEMFAWRGVEVGTLGSDSVTIKFSPLDAEVDLYNWNDQLDRDEYETGFIAAILAEEEWEIIYITERKFRIRSKETGIYENCEKQLFVGSTNKSIQPNADASAN